MEQQDLLLELYKDQIAQGRHIEVQRLEVTKFILASAAALLGVMGALKFSIQCLPLCFAVIYLGSFGRHLTATYVERFNGHMKRARALRVSLDSMVAQGKVQAILDANAVVKIERVWAFWMKIHGSLIVLGIFTVLWTIGTVTAEASSQSGSIWERLIHQLAFANGKDGGAK